MNETDPRSDGSRRPPIRRTLRHAVSKRCPRCGEDAIFLKWHEVKPACGSCGLRLQDREGDCWAFMYASTAFMTGLFLLAVLLIRPANLLLGRAVLFAAGLTVLALSLPYRKSIALGVDYLVHPDEGSEAPGGRPRSSGGDPPA